MYNIDDNDDFDDIYNINDIDDNDNNDDIDVINDMDNIDENDDIKDNYEKLKKYC